MVEGSYSQHPLLSARYDLRMFLTCAPEEQRRRLERREGAHFAAYESRWMPLEERYIRQCGPEKGRQLVIDTTEFFPMRERPESARPEGRYSQPCRLRKKSQKAGAAPEGGAKRLFEKEFNPMKHSNFKTNVHNLVLAAMFWSGAGTAFFPHRGRSQIGGMLLPMHLPVFLCGLICGWQYGAVVGFVAPLMRMALFGMPPLVAAVAMAFELAAYGGIAGFLYNRSRWQCVVALYRALLAAMVGGRIVWAAVRVVMTGVASVPFTWQIFLTEALVNAIPGIILQLVFIPVLMVALDRTGMVRFRREQAGTQAAGN